MQVAHSPPKLISRSCQTSDKDPLRISNILVIFIFSCLFECIVEKFGRYLIVQVTYIGLAECFADLNTGSSTLSKTNVKVKRQTKTLF